MGRASLSEVYSVLSLCTKIHVFGQGVAGFLGPVSPLWHSVQSACHMPVIYLRSKKYKIQPDNVGQVQSVVSEW